MNVTFRQGKAPQRTAGGGLERRRRGLRPDQPRHCRRHRTLRAAAEPAAGRADPRSVHRYRWTSRLVARRGAMVTGVDIASDLLDTARPKPPSKGCRSPTQLGDAEYLPFDDGSFDAVVSTFGVMFASRPEAAAAELARVCRRGGRIALTTWLSDSNLFRMFEVMKPYMPPPPNPAPPSPFEWGRIERIRERSGARSSSASRRACRTTASRAPKRRGARSRPATVRPERSPPAWTRSGEPRCVRTSSAFTPSSRPNSGSACHASTG